MKTQAITTSTARRAPSLASGRCDRHGAGCRLGSSTDLSGPELQPEYRHDGFLLGRRERRRTRRRPGRQGAFNPAVFGAAARAADRRTGRFSANSDDGNLNFDSVARRSSTRPDHLGDGVQLQELRRFRSRQLLPRLQADGHESPAAMTKDIRRPARPPARRLRLRRLRSRRQTPVDRRRSPGGQLGREHVHPGGMSVLNPVDVSALRTAGAELGRLHSARAWFGAVST